LPYNQQLCRQESRYCRKMIKEHAACCGWSGWSPSADIKIKIYISN
jgi:hypothetical protein